jgi:predicted DNA-binding protein with PD1-like motif
MTFVVQVDKGQEVVETLQAAVTERGLASAVVTLIGAVQTATVSVMPRNDASDDILTDYDAPFEVTGSGEVMDGIVHLHVVLAGEDQVVAGHLHRAVVQDWFVRGYITPLS